jgi:hypothetical protein
MSWEAVSALAETVGALGTVIATVYLARQIQQNTAGTRLAARQALFRENTELTRLLLRRSGPSSRARISRTSRRSRISRASFAPGRRARGATTSGARRTRCFATSF